MVSSEARKFKQDKTHQSEPNHGTPPPPATSLLKQVCLVNLVHSLSKEDAVLQENDKCP